MKVSEHPLYKQYKPGKKSSFYGKLSDLVAAETSLQLIVQIENDLRQRLRAARAVVIQSDWSAPITDKELLRVHKARLLVPELQEALTMAQTERDLRQKAVESAKKPVLAVLKQFERYEAIIERHKKEIVQYEEIIARTDKDLVAHNQRNLKNRAELDIQVAQRAIADLRKIHM